MEKTKPLGFRSNPGVGMPRLTYPGARAPATTPHGHLWNLCILKKGGGDGERLLGNWIVYVPGLQCLRQRGFFDDMSVA